MESQVRRWESGTGDGTRTRTSQLKGLPLCLSSSAGMAREAGIEPAHDSVQSGVPFRLGDSRSIGLGGRIRTDDLVLPKDAG